MGQLPKGRLFPLSRDDLVESVALIHSAETGELDALRIPPEPMDVLAQQIVAEVAATGECDEAVLFAQIRRAWSYRNLSQAHYNDVLAMLAEGYATQRGRRGAYIHRDVVNGILRSRRGARLTAITCGGAIPDQFDYEVILQPQGFRVGTLNEDFAFETLPGDIFQLGNTSYRILKVESGRVFVEDAKGQPPTLPFWLGAAPGRTDELSAAVSTLRAGVQAQLEDGDIDAARAWLMSEYGLDGVAAQQLADYLGMAQAALGALPSQDTIILERFFDEVGDMHLVIHSTFGSRLNRAWGLALWRQVVASPDVEELPLSANAQKIWQRLQNQGASFFSDLVTDAGILRTQAEDALGELCAWGLVTADSYAGLRALITPSNKRPRFAPRTRIRRRAGAGVGAAGRWAPLPTAPVPESVAFEALEHIAWVLLQRYGVVFKRLLEREQHLPPWRDLLYVYRRLEVRGEIRGGRFVDRFAGEQFALPEAVGALRKYRNSKQADALISISAADPLNLVGIVMPGERVPVALQIAGQTSFLEAVDGETEWALRNQLLRRQPASYLGASRAQAARRD